VRVRMEDCGAGSDNFSSFAPRVTRSTQKAEAARVGRSICCLGQGAPSSGLMRAIDIEDHPPGSLLIP
jgi:hypothetical protein